MKKSNGSSQTTLLRNYAAIPIANGDIESQTIFDVPQDRYQMMNVGWDGDRRVHGCVLHLDIKDGKIWIQHNTIELQIAQELAAMGIPKQDIVLGFQAPYVREYTRFGVA
ncbi:XisI protein [Nostoc paludosum FACHB-159]|uniref:XisI protein n=1 Tax=Nostoc paludosum FACHB-159 TaxID=2692908 RepID=A0ABR8K576_9NOSO|nr:XisI protein [Nostoc sp. FACHB-857]MBD2734627.1 XisI protein [Nostoc paludosum FACHB-159]